MKLEDFGKVKNKLKQEYKKNRRRIEHLDSRIDILKNNEKKEKRVIILALSLFVFGALSQFIKIDFFLTEYVSADIISGLTIGVSLGISKLINDISNKVFKRKEKLRFFSNAKTEVELIEEQLKYEIEKKKVWNKNKVLKTMIEYLDENEELLGIVSDSYYVVEKKQSKSIDELETSIKNNNKLLIQKEAELDELVMNDVLKTNFDNVNFGGNNFVGFASLVVLIVLDYNCLLLKLLGNCSYEWYNLIFPFVVGVFSCCCHTFKVRSDAIEAIGRVDSTFLSQIYDEDVDYDREIDKVLDEIFEIRMEMEDEKLKLETKQKVKDFDSKKNGNNFSYSYNPNNLREFDSASIHQQSHESHLTKKRVKDDSQGV